jgi:hypothetical protein
MIIEVKKDHEKFEPFDKEMIYLRVLNAQDQKTGD